MYETLSWGISSTGRALALHARGTGFDPQILHLSTNLFVVVICHAFSLKKQRFILGSIVVSIPACHAGDRGSIPRRGEAIFSHVL